jgi:4-coumarate--CoA ligase
MPIKSLYPELQLEKTDIFTFLFNRTDRPYPDNKVIFQDADTPSRLYTFSDLKSKALDFGKGLKSIYEFRKGEVLGLVSPNDIDVPPVVYGALWAGVVVSPANPGYTVDELAYQFKDSRAKAVAAHWSVIKNVLAAAKKVGIDEENVFIVGAEKDPRYKMKHWSSVRNLAGTSRYRQAKVDAENDLAFLVYSSGTTGKPKGVELTHHNLTSNIQQVQASEGGWLSWDGSKSCPGIPDAPKGEGDKILAPLPFFHIYGLNVFVLNPIYTGVHVLVLGKFEIEKFCRLIQDHKVTFSYIVPPMVLLLAKHPAVEKYDLSSLRMTNSGAAPLTRELVEAVYKRKGVRVKQGYGLSETSPTIFQQRWQDWNVGIGSTGRMVPNLLAKFCAVGSETETQSAKELAQGETGELYVKGPNVFKRYHNNQNATAECLEDGWFRTGDVGHIDKNGDLWITDRVKELIKYKGFQVPPAELEGYLADNELVDDVAVVGVESEELGTEVPRAYIVRKGGLGAVQQGDDQKIVAWLNAKVASHKRLRGGVKFVDAVPKSVSGKILRRILKQQAKEEFKELEAKKVKAKL